MCAPVHATHWECSVVRQQFYARRDVRGRVTRGRGIVVVVHGHIHIPRNAAGARGMCEASGMGQAVVGMHTDAARHALGGSLSSPAAPQTRWRRWSPCRRRLRPARRCRWPPTGAARVYEGVERRGGDDVARRHRAVTAAAGV